MKASVVSLALVTMLVIAYSEGLIILAETRSVRNDIPLQNITDGEYVDKGIQYEELVISKFLRSVEELPLNQEIDWADSLDNRRLETYAKVAWTISPPTPEEWIALQKKSSLKYAVKNKSTVAQRGTKFKYKYVQSDGVISLKPTSVPAIEVAATLDVSDNAHKVAATTVARMTKHMAPSIFQTLINHTKVGLFTKAETLTVYPEFAYVATPPGCESSCSGHCKSSCTFDGRKYSNLAGAGGIRAVVVDNNVFCNSNDPYHQRSNILLHEFSHTIHLFGLSSTFKKRITESYRKAKASSTWETDAYSMANDMEYFAVGSQSFFAANEIYYTTGGMSMTHLTLTTPARAHEDYRCTRGSVEVANAGNSSTEESYKRWKDHEVKRPRLSLRNMQKEQLRDWTVFKLCDDQESARFVQTIEGIVQNIRKLSHIHVDHIIRTGFIKQRYASPNEDNQTYITITRESTRWFLEPELPVV